MSSIITLIDKLEKRRNRGALEYASYTLFSRFGGLDPSWGFVIYARTSRKATPRQVNRKQQKVIATER